MNSQKIVLLILALGFLVGACETFTVPGKDNQYTMERVKNDPAFAEGLLINAYYSLPNFYNLDEEAATDDAVSNDVLSNGRRMATGEWSSKFSPYDIWSPTYNNLYYVNFFMTIVDTVQWSWQSDLRNAMFKQRLKGEAYALRGYLYHRLLVRYGGIGADNNLLGVPVVTEPIGINDNWKLPRATFQATIDQINSDYDKAISLLPAVYANKTGTSDSILAYNRVNGRQYEERLQGTIVRALKAKLALLVASPAFNNGNYDVTKAANASTLAGPLLVEKGGIGGFPSDLRFYDADNDVNNTDILWRNNYQTNNSLESQNYPPSLFGNGRINPTQNLVDVFPMKNGYPIDNPTSGYDPTKPYNNRDTRLGYFVLTNGASLRSTTINTSTDSPTSDGLNKVAGYSTRTGYYLLKLLRQNVNMNPTSTTTARHFYTHMRYTEVYLNYAESANEAWGPDGDPNGYGFTARTIIGAVRKRAGITQPDAYLASITSAADMRNLIRNERRLELCFEGHRFWDLRRWQANLTEPAKGVAVTGGVYNIINVENRDYPSYAIYGPIPLTEILKYPGLIQNKGW